MMVESIIFIVNLFIIPTIPTLIDYLKRDNEDKLIARYMLTYFIYLVVICITSNLLAMLIEYLFGHALPMTSVWYSLVAIVMTAVMTGLSSFVKIKIIKKEATKEEYGKEDK